MKKSLIFAALVACMVLAPTVAYADDPLEPWTADEQSTPYLDCDAGVWLIDVTHYYADQLEPGVYTDPVVTGVDVGVYIGNATGDSTDADCPNWVTDEDGSWHNSDTNVQHEHPAPHAPHSHPEHGKLGLEASPPKRGLTLTSELP